MPQKFAASILIIIFINSCCATSSSYEPKNDPSFYKKIADARLGPESRIDFNQDSSFFTAVNTAKKDGENLNQAIKFFIYDIKDGKIIFEDNLPSGKVEWINEYQVKVSTVPGIVSEKKGKEKTFHGYILDVKQGRKINPDVELREQ